MRTINPQNHPLIRNVVGLYRIDRTPTCGRPVGDALAALDEEDVDCIVTEYHLSADADESVSVNDAFTTRFDVDPEELAFDDIAGPAARLTNWQGSSATPAVPRSPSRPTAVGRSPSTRPSTRRQRPSPRCGRAATTRPDRSDDARFTPRGGPPRDLRQGRAGPLRPCQ